MLQSYSVSTGVARGCSGCICTLRAEKKNFRRNLLGKFVSASLSTPSAPHRPQAQQESIFKEIFCWVG